MTRPRPRTRAVVALLAALWVLPLAPARAQEGQPQPGAAPSPGAPPVTPAPQPDAPAFPSAPSPGAAQQPGVAQPQASQPPGAAPSPGIQPPGAQQPPPGPSTEARQVPPPAPGTGSAEQPPAGEQAPAPSFETRQMPPLTPGTETPPTGETTPAPPGAVATTPPRDEGAYVDGRLRYGPFLSGPGSLNFILHHTLMGAAGGLATQGVPRRFSLDFGSREAMLAGLLIGAGVGFGTSAWWQYSHWIDRPMANLGVATSVMSGMFFTGLMDLMSNDPSLLSWTAFLGTELGAWLTLALTGGEIRTGKALAIGSGGAWAMAYAALLLAILSTSGSPVTTGGAVDTLLMAPGLGAGLVALAMMHWDPSPIQVLRADLFGGVVGAAVLVLSAVVLGRFDIPTPYILSLLTSIGTIGAVSLLWVEEAEKPQVIRASPPKDQRYRSVW